LWGRLAEGGNMNEILFRIFPFLRNRMSKRTSHLLSGFGSLALLLIGLGAIIEYPEVKYSLFIAFVICTALIPVSFFISWVFDLKHAWDMRTVAVIEEDPRLSSFPQNAKFAKKLGYRYRKPTREERETWGLDKKRKVTEIIKDLWSVTQEDIEKKSSYASQQCSSVAFNVQGLESLPSCRNWARQKFQLVHWAYSPAENK
jgi:hypothetical protein